MKSLKILFIVSLALFSDSFAQCRSSFYTIGKLGVHSDIPEEQVSFGGGLGFGINLGDQPKRWQGQLNLDYFSLDPEKVNKHGFRRFSTMLQLGRMWSVKINENASLGIGGGILGVLTLNSNENPWFGQNAAPAAGVYLRVEYPISGVNGRKFHLIMDNSVFGDGFMRNVFGISYPIGRANFQ